MDIKWFYTTVSGIIISFAGLLTAIGVIVYAWKKVTRWSSNRLKMLVGYKGIIERQAVLESKIDRILAELTHNGGHSTKDVVKAVSESMVRLEGRQQAMLDAMSNGQGMFECTLFGEFLWINKDLCYLLGRTKEDLLGKGWVNSVSHKHRYSVIDEFDEALDQQREFHLKFDMVRQDGLEMPVEMKTTKMIDHQGRHLGFFGTILQLEED